MGSKRKNTADGMPVPSRVRRSEAAPTPALIPLAVEVPPPPASSAMVPSHQTEDGGRLLVQASAAEEEVLEVVRLTERYMPKKLLQCDECHVPLKAPISQCSLMRHRACIDCGAGECLLCRDSGDAAVYIQNPFLDTIFIYNEVACPYSKYGCASSVVYGDDAAHMAACAYAPCECRECSFEGSPAELVGHLTDMAGQHAWTATKFKYGKGIRIVFNLQYPLVDRPLVAEDGCVFMLLARNFMDGTHGFKILCVRNNAPAGPVYSSAVTVLGPLPAGCTRKTDVLETASCLAPLEAAMAPDDEDECALQVKPRMRRGEEIHLQICISKNRKRSMR